MCIPLSLLYYYFFYLENQMFPFKCCLTEFYGRYIFHRRCILILYFLYQHSPSLFIVSHFTLRVPLLLVTTQFVITKTNKSHGSLGRRINTHIQPIHVYLQMFSPRSEPKFNVIINKTTFYQLNNCMIDVTVR